MDLKLHIRTALAYFLLAALLGTVLRFFPLVKMPITYKFFVHTHSHIALLGWAYVALTTLLYKLYMGNLKLDGKYRSIFWFTQITLVGMLLTFPFQGYAQFSIIFSTLFLFASYWFAWFFFKNVPIIHKETGSYQCLAAALWYLVLSSMGPWALGGIMNTLGGDSTWYRLAIYFYLHFLYNGWMIMALVGILFYVFEKHGIGMSHAVFKRFLLLMNLGIVLSFLLSTLFTNPPIILNVIGGTGVVIQLLALGTLLKTILNHRDKLHGLFSVFQMRLLKVIGWLLTLKMLLQLLTATPYFANLASTFLDFTIGYLHWTFLGVVSLGLILFLDCLELLKIPRNAYRLYLSGFAITESLIFYKGIAAWQNFPIFDGYFEILAMGSLLIPLSLILMISSKIHQK